eukprot:TRINITY_DN861_c0_g2_i1.p2 TRINITY_DN861_c0_g2~~TRINITY_DN861_c0_g2_i1.p2  ORF type:complete len:407 (+),score=134.97 TRINITY_DN861_c0_g2_i1:67-1287(+)
MAEEEHVAVCVPTEETPLCADEHDAVKPAQSRCAAFKNFAAVTVSVVGATLLLRAFASDVAEGVPAGAVRKFPQSLDDVFHHLPLYSFLFVTVFITFRNVAHELGKGSKWDCPKELFFFTVVVVWPIINGDQGGSGGGCVGSLVNAGCIAAIVAAVCYNVGVGRGDILSTLSVVSGALIVAGTALPQTDKSFWDNLPFWSWALTGCVYYVFLLCGKKQDAAGPFLMTSWLMVVYAALASRGRGGGGDDWEHVCLTVGSVCAIVMVFAYAFDVLDGNVRVTCGCVALALLWFPLCWDTLQAMNGDQIVDKAPFFAFCVTLFCCALFECLLKDKRVMSGRWVLLIELYVILWTKGNGAGQAGDWKTVAQIGCLIGLIALICEMLKVGQHLCLLVSVAEFMCVLALLFG